MAPQIAPTPAASAGSRVLDELEKYSLLPVETNLDLDVLAWWKARDHNMPANSASGRPEGLPHLAKMARQFLGRPKLQGWERSIWELPLFNTFGATLPTFRALEM